MSDTIPVVWCFGNRGDRCHGMLQHAFSGQLWPTTLTFRHILDHNDPEMDGHGAVVIVSGGVQRAYADEIARALDKLSWALVVVAADEEGRFPWRKLLGPNRKIWLQMPHGDKHAGVDRKFCIGWPGGTREILAKLAPACPDASRRFPWAFIGQMQHPQRRACVEMLGRRTDGGLLSRTAGYSRGYKVEEYLQMMTCAYLAPNPSGTHTADCFRIWESLEAGCLPIVERRCPSEEANYDYWADLLGGPPPFPVVTSWEEFNTLGNIFRGMPEKRQQETNRAMAWWIGQKRALVHALEDDISSLADGDRGKLGTGLSPSPLKHSPDKFIHQQEGDSPEMMRRMIWRCNWDADWFGTLPVLT